jgi:hypothetical protein
MRRSEQCLPRAMRIRARSTDSCLIPVSKCLLLLDIIVVIWLSNRIAQ